MSKVIGIDLGTTKCSVAAMVRGELVIIPNSYGNKTTPSVVAFSRDGRILVGEDALSQAILNVKNTFFNVKRSMGSSHKFFVKDKSFTPQQIVSYLLIAMKQAAEAYLGDIVNDAVISVPASFNDAQRLFTYDAAKIAGFNGFLRIINEPTAAALAYGLDKKQDETILVFDLGGGTFDVSVLKIGDGVFEVLAVNGDTGIGGINFDKRIADWLISEFAKEYPNINLLDYDMALERLMDAAEKAKVELSSVNEVEIYIPYIASINEHAIDLKSTITREELENMISDLVKQTIEKCRLTLSEAGLDRKNIDKVILAGRQTRMPIIQQTVAKFFGKEPCRGVDPSEAVVLGTAIQAGVLNGEIEDVLLLDIIPISLGIETVGGVMTCLIEKNTTIPTLKRQVFSTTVDGQESVDIHVLQGEQQLARDNKTVGRLRLDGISPAPKGTPQIEVKFDIDANSIVNITAKNIETGREVNAKIEDRGILIEPAPGSLCPYGRWILR